MPMRGIAPGIYELELIIGRRHELLIVMAYGSSVCTISIFANPAMDDSICLGVLVLFILLTTYKTLPWMWHVGSE